VTDQLSGILVPASRIVRSDVQGLRGLEIGDTFAFDRRARVSPSYEDLRGITPAAQKYDPLPVSGGEAGFPYEAGEWLPSDLDDLELWFDQQELEAVGDGNTMQTWADLSGSGRDLTQATASFRPTVQNVGYDAVLDPIWEAQFDGVNDLMSSSIPGTATVVIGVAWRLLSAVGAGTFYVHSGVLASEPATSIVGENLSANNGTAAHPPIGLEPHYTVAVFDGVASYLRLDGRQVQAGLFVGSQDIFRLGSLEPPNFVNIGVRAIVVTSEPIDDEEILLLESFLRYRARS
jgi:hypothetical protein